MESIAMISKCRVYDVIKNLGMTEIKGSPMNLSRAEANNYRNQGYYVEEDVE